MLLFITGEQDEPSHASKSPLLADMRQTQHSHPLKLEQKQKQNKCPKGKKKNPTTTTKKQRATVLVWRNQADIMLLLPEQSYPLFK